MSHHRYRMLAELVTTGGLALEVSTSLHPDYFLLLACTGNFAKALGKGMSKPAFRYGRVIGQGHVKASQAR